MHRLYVCRTCARDARPPPGEATLGERLGARIEALAGAPGAPEVELRRVACLSGCRRPGNVALRAAGKYGLRFSALSPADAPAVLELAAAYVASGDGDVPEAAWPPALRGKQTVRSPPPGAARGQPRA